MSKEKIFKQTVVIFTNETYGDIPLITIGNFMKMIYESLKEKGIFVADNEDDTIVIRPNFNELENTFKNMKTNNITLAIFVYLPNLNYFRDIVKKMGKQYLIITKTLKYHDIVKFAKTKRKIIIQSFVSSILNKITKNPSYFI
ncbi:Hypothetical protein SRAE_X000255700 [Strongyloides ratti]|uniref:Uncharacterized protein n=1 Tax=Strongyloides ratti TaxID=34506 RepID=A0A090KZZ4_STRRB|nr:Hypothetical protein SRAE_X000255700 [Strongyloides ratti]CEF60774.1 Hypothetical protein SRAE_X000255700 [Strongyloides ratti]